MSDGSEPQTANQLPVPTSAAQPEQEKPQYSLTQKVARRGRDLCEQSSCSLSGEVTEKPRPFRAEIQICQQLGLFTLVMGIFTQNQHAPLEFGC